MLRPKLTKFIATICFNLFLSSLLLATSHAYLGVHISDLTKKDYEKAGMKELYGVQVMKVTKDSPADKAGLKKDDIILTLDGEKIYTFDQLNKMLNLFKPDQLVKLDIWRSGKKMDLKLTLGERKGMELKKKAYLGVYLHDLEEDDYEEIGLKNEYGVLIDNIVEDGPADKAGIKAKDILVELDDNKIYTSDQVSKMLKTMEIGKRVKTKVFREGKYKKFDVELGEKEYGFDLLFGDKSLQFLNDPSNVLVYRYFDKNGKWIGIKTMELNEQLKESFQIKNGVMISEVIEDTPAEEAGLIAGDIIVLFDGEKIEQGNDLTAIISKKEIGEEIEAEILRDKKIKKLNIKIEKREHDRDERVEVSFEEGDVRVWVDGMEEFNHDVSKTLDNIDKIQSLKKGIGAGIKSKQEELIERIEDIDLEFEIIDQKIAKEL